MYTKTLAAVLVIATAHASRLTARAGRGDVIPTASDDGSASSDATTAALSIAPHHWWPWPRTCDVRKTFSVNAPNLWYAASVPDLMDCTEEQSVTGTW